MEADFEVLRANRPMSQIFISYRREDSAGHTGRLRDALSAEFGAARIFRDLDTIAPGDDFVQAISRGVASCAVFLAVIGRNWLAAADREGRRRLDMPADHVRTELTEALQRGVRVIPVLVQGASMPQASDLPDSLKPLADRNAIALDDDDWPSDVQRLVQAIRHALGGSAAPRAVDERGRSRLWMAASGAAVIALVAFALVNRSCATASSPSDPLPSSVATPGVTRSSSSSARAGTPAKVTLTAGGEAALGQLVYEIMDAGVNTGSEGHALRLRVRLTNHGRYAAGFGDSDFRLKIGDDVTAPTSGVGDIVAGESTKENTISFPLSTSAAAATLRVVSAGETAEIPLDLTGREGLTAPQDRDLRRAGKRTAALPLDADKARLRFGDLTCEVRSASAHRYVNKLVLTLSVRAQNNGRYDAGFGDYHFRLLLGGTAQAPVSGLSTVVSPQTSLDGSIVFDLPLDARDVVIRVRYFETTAELPLTIPAAR